jgi:NAD(P)-dependent dehydrogenase (short-subunit alcohol dehydrogenase family)
MECKEFEGRVAIVTGGGQGIGEAYCQGLADAGASVAVADINIENGERTASEIRSRGGSATFVEVDVANPASVEEMVETVVSTLGGIDFLVNNAAIFHGMRLDSLMTVEIDYYEKIIATNMTSILHCTRACAPAMLLRGGGAIVNQSSTAAWMAGTYYSVAKAGVNSLTVCLASELGPQGVRVNAIAPGTTDTEATRMIASIEQRKEATMALPLQRMGSTADIVGACLFLLSERSSWITGQILAVDGGFTKRI